VSTVDVDLLQVSLSLSYDIDPLYCILHDVVRRGGAGKRDLSCFLSVFICIDLAQCKGKSCIFGSVLNRDFPKLTSLSFSLRLSVLRYVMYTIVDRYDNERETWSKSIKMAASCFVKVTDKEMNEIKICIQSQKHKRLV
jgi:hypothetical protein